MKQEKVFFSATMILLLFLISVTVICAVKYMDEEPAWNRDPVPIETEAPDAARLDELGQNRPPGGGVTLEQDEHAERSNL